jgi:hypothetical protein
MKDVDSLCIVYCCFDLACGKRLLMHLSASHECMSQYTSEGVYGLLAVGALKQQNLQTQRSAKPTNAAISAKPVESQQSAHLIPPSTAEMSSTNSNLGEPCRFLWGKHYGKKAWFDKKGDDSKEKYAVVTLEEDGAYKKRSGFKYMIAKGHHGSSAVQGCREEAAFDKLPELERATSALCTKLAKCNLKPSEKLTTMFNERLAKANERQNRKGTDALWYKIDKRRPTNVTAMR